MSTTAPAPTTAPNRARRRDPLLMGIRVLLAAFGAFKLYGTAYFTFFATAAEGGDPQGVVDWLVATWSAVLAVSLVVAALLLRTANRTLVRTVVVLLLVEVAFSLVKLVAYDEIEALGFMAVDLVIAGLLALAVRRSR